MEEGPEFDLIVREHPDGLLLIDSETGDQRLISFSEWDQIIQRKGEPCAKCGSDDIFLALDQLLVTMICARCETQYSLDGSEIKDVQ